MKRPNIKYTEDEWNCPYIRVKTSDGIVLDMEEVSDSYRDMISILIEVKKELETLIENTHIEGVHVTEDVLTRVNETLQKSGVEL